MNYSIFHVERYGHGKASTNALTHDQQVTIADEDGWYDVYECESGSEAQRIADWYLTTYESYPDDVHIIEHNERYFSIELDD